MAQKNLMSARALTMDELENVNGGDMANVAIKRLIRKHLKKRVMAK